MIVSVPDTIILGLEKIGSVTKKIFCRPRAILGDSRLESRAMHRQVYVTLVLNCITE